MRLRPYIAALICALAAAVLASGCGEDGDTSGTPAAGPAESMPAPPKSAFPKPEGRSLEEVVKLAVGPAPVVSPAAMAFSKGENRYSFGVFHSDHTAVSDAEVALYIAKVPSAKGEGKV